MVCTHYGVLLFSNDNAYTTTANNNMNDSHNDYVKWKKSDISVQPDSSYVKYHSMKKGC